MLKQRIVFLFFFFQPVLLPAQTNQQPWHNKIREVHYQPDGEDFLLVNGKRRFNRALYGTNTAFRVEAGDLPEFALYMPGMGGNLKFGLLAGEVGKWMIDADEIESRYRPGSMVYKIKDSLLGNGQLEVTVLALADAEGMIVKVCAIGVDRKIKLLAAYGGASGNTFSRNGDIGADPESGFYLLPAYCEHNQFDISNKQFTLSYLNKRKGEEQIVGFFSATEEFRLIDAERQGDPKTLWESEAGNHPAIAAISSLTSVQDTYFLLQNPRKNDKPVSLEPEKLFASAEARRIELTSRIRLKTPDAYINTLGGALAVAADGIWESPTYLHGAVAWRMRLNAWRGAYTADPLGWHDRAREHFNSYARSQVLAPDSAKVVADTVLHLARHQEKMGTAMFSSGYISRNPHDNTIPHHYDMNLVFFDQMLTHFNYTGDVGFMKEMWPVIKRHLAWEKRNFDRDGDGLYDAYCAIWASDGLQYSGGGVTHTSAYNYRANLLAARLANILGEDPAPFRNEAAKILQAINARLWMPDYGWYAEYQDLLGAQLLHDRPGLWTIYHAIDSKVPDMFQAYQSLRYIDRHIPHIPIYANGMEEKGFYTLSTTDWQPYTWSVNNVALAEVLHTALAYWQGGRSEEAFNLWKGNIMESFYLGASPGNFQQLSFYDARRGELYRDFGDPIGVASRTLVEGLFGIVPDALVDTLTVRPGFPAAWQEASLKLPTISFDFKRLGNRSTYTIKPDFPVAMHLRLQIPAYRSKVKEVLLNGKNARWKPIMDAVGKPMLEIEAQKTEAYQLLIEWEGEEPEVPGYTEACVIGEDWKLSLSKAVIKDLYDPQRLLREGKLRQEGFSFKDVARQGSFFVQLEQGDFSWWAPIDVVVVEPVAIGQKSFDNSTLTLELQNSAKAVQKGSLFVNGERKGFDHALQLSANSTADVSIPVGMLTSGTNVIRFEGIDGRNTSFIYQNWDVVPTPSAKWETVAIQDAFNDRVDRLFEQKYLSPRPASPTLQLPWQGIGNWCYPLTEAQLDDSGLRRKAGKEGVFTLPNGIPFSTSEKTGDLNICFTSTWDNYPQSRTINLAGKAKHAYFMMAGSTNPMQSQLDNAEILISYEDGTTERLALKNPDNWWPIEQDYYHDGYAFRLPLPKPYRIHLKTGEVRRDHDDYVAIKGFTDRAIDGGAATILDMPLDPNKELKSLKLTAIANDVVIGLMAITLQRQ